MLAIDLKSIIKTLTSLEISSKLSASKIKSESDSNAELSFVMFELDVDEVETLRFLGKV